MALTCRNILYNISVNKLRSRGRFLIAEYGSYAQNPTAALIIIGDEILKAQVQDTNSHFMCSSLYHCGVKVKKISVVSDDIDEIAEEIVKFSQKYTYVITSGGIGPTHDDVTFEAVAKAFDDSLHYHSTLVDVVKKFSVSQDLTSPSFKLAHIPTSASLKFGTNQDTGQKLAYPCVYIKNVFIFPGSPIFLRRSFGNLYKELFGTGKQFFATVLYVSSKEETFADALTIVSDEFPNVTFGSYPTMNHSYYHARVTIESVDQAEMEKAAARFQELAPRNSIINYDVDPMKDALKKFENLVASDKGGSLYQKTFALIKSWYSEPSTVAICFDGSIETTVLLHLAYLANLSIEKRRLRAIFSRPVNGFAEVDEFVKESENRYDLNLIVIQEGAKDVLPELSKLHPDLKTVLLGSKVSNSKGGRWHVLSKNGSIDGIDVKSPLADWTYRDVWNLARSLSLPYCKLYDQGYTSLGNRDDTLPNPNLLREPILGRTEYNSAHTLKNVDSERVGRISNGHPKANES